MTKLISVENKEETKKLSVSFAKEQFDSLTLYVHSYILLVYLTNSTCREEIKEILVKFDFVLTEQASAALLEVSENKQVRKI